MTTIDVRGRWNCWHKGKREIGKVREDKVKACEGSRCCVPMGNSEARIVRMKKVE